MLNILSVEYEVAHQTISTMLQKGLISKAEFEAIDKENLKSFTKNN
ncbi:MAG: SHOCT domain-containing protein [Desulfitobacteriaceae bacterium]